MKSLTKILCLFCFLPLALSAVEDIQTDIMIVVGNGKAVVTATVAEVRLAVEADGRTASEVQQLLATNSQPVVDLLKGANVTKLESGAINIYPQYSSGTPSVIVGYRGSNIIKFETTVQEAGKLTDAALKVGATSVQGITMRPEEGILTQARSEALRAAIDGALRDSNVVLTALKLKFIGITQVDVTPENRYSPVQNRQFKAMALGSTESSTEVLAQEQDINATVTLHIRYGQAQ